MVRQTVKVEVNALQEGMFVSDLDRPWHETPFPLQGFYIKQDDDIKALQGYCKYVFVDSLKQRSAKRKYGPHAEFNPTKKAKVQQKVDDSSLKLPPIVIKKPQVYEVAHTLSKEVGKAKKLHAHVYEAMSEVFQAVQDGTPVSMKETERVAEGMVESVVRNPDALVWLSKMHEQDVRSYQHAIRAAIWALVFGRHLGLDKKTLKTLALGVLLMHVGRLQQSNESANAERDYVLAGLNVLSEVKDLPKAVLVIAEYHSERHNGSGFPKGVTGDRIPLLAKIAGLVDVYQGLIEPRDEQTPGLSPLDAVGKLYEMRNIAFQQDLVERFIEAIGVYPTGTLVLLSSGEVAIVTGHNEGRRLMPKVSIVLDAQKQMLKRAKAVDLKEFNERKSNDEMLVIRDSLPKGAFGIDEKRYLDTAGGKWNLRNIAGQLLAS